MIKQLINIGFYLLLFVFLLFFMLFNSHSYAVSYTDIEDHWAKNDIIELTTNSVLNGYCDNTFKPNNSVTTAEFLKMIVASHNYSLVQNGGKIWPDFYINTAKQHGLILNDEFSNFNAPISRYDAVLIVSRLLDLSSVKENKNNYIDVKDEYLENVLKLSKLKIINGYPDKTFRGENPVTRAEAVSFLKRTLDKEKSINSKKDYDISKRTDLSNYKSSNNKTNFEIVDNKLIINDFGRYAELADYEITDNIIDITKVVKIINSLICENTYTQVTYIPSKYTINQLKISYGKNKTKLENGEADFSLTYYEDKEYELARISMEEEFNTKVYMKLEVFKLWDNYSDYLAGNYIDSFKKEKLLNVLQIEFGKENGKKILDYILEKNELYVTNQLINQRQVERKKFGKYSINFYYKDGDIPKFYINKSN